MRMNISGFDVLLIVLVYFVLASIIAGWFSEVAREKGQGEEEKLLGGAADRHVPHPAVLGPCHGTRLPSRKECCSPLLYS